MKKIALDVDGVIFDSETLYRVYGEIFDIEKYHKDTLIDNSKRIFQDRYQNGENDYIEFYKKVFEKVITEANYMTGIDVVLEKLKNDYEFIIVTARDDIEQNLTMERYKKLGLDNIKMYNNIYHKLDIYIKENVDYVIDDDENICKEAGENNFKAFYLKNGASNKINSKGVINVNNWGEIYKYLILHDNISNKIC